ncbi:MAG TPA: hypothetical protein VN258_09840 [Mobilitalea sp.]|nr:hypothetical protein [Mobilitalea sp.]
MINYGYDREPDYNIYHFDYNNLFLEQYARYQTALESGAPINSGDEIPHFSFSSMSPVLAGFIAIIKSISLDLTKYEIKQLLDSASYANIRKGDHWYDLNPCPKVIDIGKAAELLYQKEKELI